MACKWIQKVGLATLQNGRLLVVRKRGASLFILPGGKPEGDESDLETLAREIDEELGCRIEQPFLRGVFKDVAADASNAVVVVRLYSATLVGEPQARSEIEEMAWVELNGGSGFPLAPSIVNGILPHLRKRERASSILKRTIFDEAVQRQLQIV
jgi:8-oxo-dGTP diphosphatase